MCFIRNQVPAALPAVYQKVTQPEDWAIHADMTNFRSHQAHIHAALPFLDSCSARGGIPEAAFVMVPYQPFLMHGRTRLLCLWDECAADDTGS